MKELRRKIIHLLLGSLFIIGYLKGFLVWWHFFFLLITGLLGIMIIHVTHLIDLEKMLKRYDRDDAYLPGWGAINLIQGFLVASLLFPTNIAAALMAIITYGDGTAAIIGHTFGRRKLAWNPQKTIIGTITGLFVSFIATTAFLAWPLALVASSTGMLVETLKKPSWLDDNFFIPLATGIVVLLLLLP